MVSLNDVLKFCSLMLCAIHVSGSAIPTQDQPFAKANHPTASCPEGWVLFEDVNQFLCIYFSNETATFAKASDECSNKGAYLISAVPGTTNMDFFKEQVMEIYGEFWIGLTKSIGYDAPYVWSGNLDNTNTSEASVEELPGILTEYPSYKEQCVYMSGYTDSWETDDCSTEYRYGCQKTSLCESGYFGSKCDRQCHCIGEICDSGASPVTCLEGCQRSWWGHACDKPRVEPKVTYFCINGRSSSNEPDPYVYIRLTTNGFENTNIFNYDDGTLLMQCGRNYHTQALKYRQDPNTMRVYIVRAAHQRGYFAETPRGSHICYYNNNKEHGNKYKWLVQIREKPIVSLEHDLDAVITCDFDKAEELNIEHPYSVESIPSRTFRKPVVPKSVLEDVSLTLVDAHTKKVLNEAELGKPVTLQVHFNTKTDSLVKSVKPYDCSAKSSEDNNVVLVNKHGCLMSNSPITSTFQKKSDHLLETRWFPLFNIDNSNFMTFSCSFDFCFDEDDCQANCNLPDGEKSQLIRRKRSQSSGTPNNDTNPLSGGLVTKTVRVVQSDHSDTSAYGTQ